MKTYIRTDLACEKTEERRDAVTEEKIGRFTVYRAGESVCTVECGRIWEEDRSENEALSEILSAQIRRMTTETLGKKPTSVLVAGLGNNRMTVDAVGPKTAEKIHATRHLKGEAPELFSLLGNCEVSVLSPGVLGQTGIETVELIRGAAENVRPDLVVAIDALAARSVARLSTTVQLSCEGISPGSGVGNRRKRIDSDSLGVPVLCIGVPTVVDSSTLVYDALQKAGIKSVSEDLRNVLEEGREFFVSPRECDLITEKVSDLLASALEKAFGVSV